MSNCNNNCEAVADLHEASANIIQYRDLINKWLNGGQNETVNIGGDNIPTLLGLALAIKELVGVWPDDITIKIDSVTKKIYVPLKTGGGLRTSSTGLYIDSSDFLQLGGGLAKDSQGNIYVDFDQMPTTKFDAVLETFRKGLRLPKWLIASMNFYVDKSHASAANTLVEGRGLSANLPFASIQACASYVADNYNVSNYVANILVKGGTYEEQLTLPDFSKGTGYINIRPFSASDEVILAHNFNTGSNSNGVRCTGGRWHIDGIDFVNTLTADNAVNNRVQYRYFIYAMEGAELTLTGCKYSLAASLAVSNAALLNMWLLYANGGTINMVNKSNVKNRTSEISVATGSKGENKNVYALGTTVGGVFSMAGSQDSEADSKCSVTGSFSTFCQISGGDYKMAGNFVYPFKFNENYAGAVTGKRYEAINGGRINTGLGADYFPGNTAGTVEASTYSWYK